MDDQLKILMLTMTRLESGEKAVARPSGELLNIRKKKALSNHEQSMPSMRQNSHVPLCTLVAVILRHGEGWRHQGRKGNCFRAPRL
jgi:hypothetical protein